VIRDPYVRWCESRGRVISPSYFMFGTRDIVGSSADMVVAVATAI